MPPEQSQPVGTASQGGGWSLPLWGHACLRSVNERDRRPCLVVNRFTFSWPTTIARLQPTSSGAPCPHAVASGPFCLSRGGWGETQVAALDQRPEVSGRARPTRRAAGRLVGTVSRSDRRRWTPAPPPPQRGQRAATRRQDCRRQTQRRRIIGGGDAQEIDVNGPDMLIERRWLRQVSAAPPAAATVTAKPSRSPVSLGVEADDLPCRERW